MNSSENLLILFAIEPVPGLVKTGLAGTIGDDRACDLYELLVDISVEKFAGSSNWRFALAVTPKESAPYFKTLYPGIEVMHQSEGDPGLRMLDALRQGFQSGAKKVIVLVGDCPSLEPSRVRSAFEILTSYPMVIGYAASGGHVFMGARRELGRKLARAFKNIEWSPEKEFKQTFKNLSDAGVDFMVLSAPSNLDTMDDLDRFHQENCGNPKKGLPGGYRELCKKIAKLRKEHTKEDKK